MCQFFPRFLDVLWHVGFVAGTAFCGDLVWHVLASKTPIRDFTVRACSGRGAFVHAFPLHLAPDFVTGAAFRGPVALCNARKLWQGPCFVNAHFGCRSCELHARIAPCISVHCRGALRAWCCDVGSP